MRTQRLFVGIAALLLASPMTLPVPAQQARVTTAESAGELANRAHQLAQSAKKLDELTEALRVCSQSLKANPSKETREYVNRLASWTYNKRGEKLVELAERTAQLDEKRASEYEAAALKDFDLAVRIDGNPWKSRFNRAVSLAMVGEYEPAVEDLNFVLRQKPKHRNARFNRAEILAQIGEFEAAVADYDVVIELDPQDASSFSGRGMALSLLGHKDKSMLDFQAAIRLQPENADAYVDRADLHAANGDWERAAGDYRVAIRLDEKNGRAYHNVAWLMATCPEERFRNGSLAIRAAKKAIQLEGQTFRSLDTLAAAYASVGDFERAGANIQQSLAKAPRWEQEAIQARLGLYQQGLPFREASDDPQVQLASGEEPIIK